MLSRLPPWQVNHTAVAEMGGHHDDEDEDHHGSNATTNECGVEEKKEALEVRTALVLARVYIRGVYGYMRRFARTLQQHAHVYVFMHTHGHTLRYIHAYTYIHTRTHIHIHIIMDTHYKYTYSYSYTYAHTRIHLYRQRNTYQTHSENQKKALFTNKIFL